MTGYTFTLVKRSGSSVTTRTATPIYPNEFAIEYSKESEEMFFRPKWVGELTFLKDDYTFIADANIESTFLLNVVANNQLVLQGTFAKTDCEIDYDNKILRVTPNANDAYNTILAGLENEYDLIDLAPPMADVKLDKRMCLQVYVPGDSVVGCFTSGMYWEQSCKEVTDISALANTYHFGLVYSVRVLTLDDDRPSDMPKAFFGRIVDNVGTFTNGDYTITYNYYSTANNHRYIVTKGSDTLYFTPYYSGTIATPAQFYEYGTTTTAFTAAVSTTSVYGRYILDKESISGTTIYDLPSDDIVDNNRNYSKCIKLGLSSNLLVFSSTTITTPTKYGQMEPGQYYTFPSTYSEKNMYPIAKSTWGSLSLWLDGSAFDWILEGDARKQYTLRYAYPLDGVIRALLTKIGVTGVGFYPSSSYSQFLYGSGTGIKSELFYPVLVPKSNILAGEFDEPAQEAPITLKKVFDMLAKTMQCYWYIDSGKLRIEHIKYFKNGLTYGSPSVGKDLTSLTAPNGKAWSFGQGKVAYDKLEMPERYEFGWMDDVTTPFQGEAMQMNSAFVEDGQVNKVSVDYFTSDVDYMLLNPSACDLDGFALLFPIKNSDDEYVLPYWGYGSTSAEETYHQLQNGYASFKYLQDFYKYDLPCRSYTIGSDSKTATMLNRKLKQEVAFPSTTIPDPYKQVQAGITWANGAIRSMTYNLVSNKVEAVLEYENDTTLPT